ncbi:hypothetical protein RRG08_042684 [Elysia crispata]|uniref:Uncharacterized protein n=1 Tax=Elysia crispata TaxID=231223 RepID=A0AAE1CKG1_9GAST|nr:hypothetical protein RRG08_042684 [Elysia crispata]
MKVWLCERAVCCGGMLSWEYGLESGIELLGITVTEASALRQAKERACWETSHLTTKINPCLAYCQFNALPHLMKKPMVSERRIISCGDDASTRIWDLVIGDSKPATQTNEA